MQLRDHPPDDSQEWLSKLATKMDNDAPRQGGSLYDSRNGHGTDLMGDSEKRAGLPHLSKNFHDTFRVPMFTTADDETVFKNLVLTRGRVTERQEALVLINCEFNNHPKQRLERMRKIEVANFFYGEAHMEF
jgi:hypothetical protein